MIIFKAEFVSHIVRIELQRAIRLAEGPQLPAQDDVHRQNG
jgi:hypothetical protein